VTDPDSPGAPGTERPWTAGPPRVIPPHVFEPPRPAAPSFRGAIAPLVPVFVLDVLTAFTVGMVPPLLPLVVADFALSTAEAGLVNTLHAAGRLAGSYPASRIRARWGTRTAVVVGLAGLLVGALGCALAPSFALFLLGRVVMGLGASVAFLAIFAELLEAAPARFRGRLANAFEATAILSLAVSGVLAAALAQAAGWRVVFAAVALVMLACGLAARRLPPGAGRRDPEAPGPARPVSVTELRALAPIYGACFALAWTWSGLFATMAPLLGHDRYALGATAIGLALSAGYVAELAGLLVMGLVIDRLRREPLFLGGAVAVLAGGLLLAVGAQPLAFVLGLVLVGGGFAVWMIPATVLADRVGTPLPPTHLAVFRIALDAGMILGPLLIGLLATVTGDRVAVGAAGLVLVGGALALARDRRAAVVR